MVSALAAEWIEIFERGRSGGQKVVSALAAEWIEILFCGVYLASNLRLRPRGGVD